MVLWRISRHLDLLGIGGLRASARWHVAGHPIVYLAESPSAALLEVCVHTCANDVPSLYTLLRIEGPDDPGLSAVTNLPEGWANRIEVTQKLGMSWLQGKESLLLRVPSAIIPETFNILFNPLHQQASSFRITDTFTYPFDPRLKQ